MRPKLLVCVCLQLDEVYLNLNQFFLLTESDSPKQTKSKGPKQTNCAKRKPESNRVSWAEEEKETVMKRFAKHIKKKIPPRKKECEELLQKFPKVFVNKDWVKIKTYVYNCYRTKP